MPLNSAKLSVSMNVNQSGANAFSGGPHWSAAFEQVLNFVNGTGANQADLAYVAERTVASASNDDIDLAGVLTDAFGATFTTAEMVALLIVNKQKDGTANTTNLTIGAGSNPWVGALGGTTPTIGPIRPGGVLLLASPDAAGIGAVVAGTGDILRVANSSGAQNKFLIGILARSA
jgi:hypothetical protein